MALLFLGGSQGLLSLPPSPFRVGPDGRWMMADGFYCSSVTARVFCRFLGPRSVSDGDGFTVPR